MGLRTLEFYTSLLFIASQAYAGCQPELAFIPPKLNAGSLEGAFGTIRSALDAQAAKGVFNTTSFSLQISSSNQDLFSLFRAADTPTSRGTRNVDGSSIYRIASNTKLFTALGILQQDAAGKLSLDHPLSHYVSNLRNTGSINWSKITLRALLSHLSGIPDSCELVFIVVDTELC
jgi:CubicO group peptidase (beta-lactamase class C family)